MDENDFKRLLEDMSVDMRRHFDVMAERLEKKVDGVEEKVALVDEKLDRKFDALEERMESGFTETQAMIRFSHAELVADLQARVERIESSTH